MERLAAKCQNIIAQMNTCEKPRRFVSNGDYTHALAQPNFLPLPRRQWHSSNTQSSAL